MVELLHVTRYELQWFDHNTFTRYSLAVTMVGLQHVYTLLVRNYYGWIVTRVHVTSYELQWLDHTFTRYSLAVTMVET